MAKAFNTRQGGSPEAALAGIGSTLINLSSVLSDEGIDKETNRQVSNFRIAMLAGATARDDFVADNADDPEAFLRYTSDIRENLRIEATKGLTTAEAKEIGSLEFDETMAKWESGLATSARKQAGRNAVTDSNLSSKMFMSSRAFKDEPGFLEYHSEGLIHFATLLNTSDDEKLTAQRAFTQFNVSQFLLQHGTEEQIKDPNKFIM